jgi:hypothetical protein
MLLHRENAQPDLSVMKSPIDLKGARSSRLPPSSAAKEITVPILYVTLYHKMLLMLRPVRGKNRWLRSTKIEGGLLVTANEVKTLYYPSHFRGSMYGYGL